MKKSTLYQKYRAKISSTRGRKDRNGNPIRFSLSYDEWRELWLYAGVMPGNGWVLSRKDDLGDYIIGNVFVQHNLYNVMEHHGKVSDLDKKINEYCIKYNCKRYNVKNMIKRGELVL